MFFKDLLISKMHKKVEIIKLNFNVNLTFCKRCFTFTWRNDLVNMLMLAFVNEKLKGKNRADRHKSAGVLFAIYWQDWWLRFKNTFILPLACNHKHIFGTYRYMCVTISKMDIWKVSRNCIFFGKP